MPISRFVFITKVSRNNLAKYSKRNVPDTTDSGYKVKQRLIDIPESFRFCNSKQRTIISKAKQVKN